MDREIFFLLSRLWLSEPDEGTLQRACEVLGLKDQVFKRDEIAVAYSDLFLLNVYPYASVFLDSDGEMNGLRSQEILGVYQRFGYQPASLDQAGAPDHLGLLLGLLAHVPQADCYPVLSEYILDFAPVLCLAVERQPAAHPFYHALAVRTRLELFRALDGESRAPKGHRDLETARPAARIELPLIDDDEELTLSKVIHGLLCPARSGIFISRNRLGLWARQLGIPLAFGERNRLGLSLFEAAGMVERIPEILEWLDLEIGAWDAAYSAWAAEVPAWAGFAAEWRRRTAWARRLLEEAQFSVRTTAV